MDNRATFRVESGAMIETYLLRGLAEIERTGSFTAAAKALFVSQPALSRAIMEVERGTLPCSRIVQKDRSARSFLIGTL
jgi:molybdenum-dependent DNA-binding transcriptional regulator ModE